MHLKRVSFILAAAYGVLISISGMAGSFDQDLAQAEKLLRTGANTKVLDLASSIRTRAFAENDLASAGRAYVLSAQASYTLGKMEQMKRFIQEAINVFEKIDDAAGLGKSYYVYSIYHQKSGSSLEMQKLLHRALTFANKANDPELKIRVGLGLGLSNWNLGHFGVAINEIEKAVGIAKTLKDPHLLALGYENLALNHSARGDFNSALTNYRKALSIFEHEKNDHALAYVYGNMGVTYEKIGNFEEAMSCFEKSLALHQKNGYIFGQSIQTDNIAEVHERLEQHDQAIELTLKAISLAKKEGPWLRVQLFQNMAERYLAAGYIPESKFYALQAAEEIKKIQNPLVTLRNFTLLSRLAQEDGNNDEAIELARKGIDSAERMGEFYQLGLLKATEARALVDLNRTAEAAAAYRQAIQLHETIYSQAYLSRWYSELAQIHANAGRVAEAKAEFEKSLTATLKIADLLVMDRFRIDLLREASEIHRKYASFLASLGEHLEAWKIVEQGRSRDLALRIAQATGVVMNDEQRDLLGLIHKIQQNLSSGDINPSELPALYAQLTVAASAYEQTQKSAAIVSGRWNGPISDLYKNKILIEYAFDEQRLLIFSSIGNNTTFRMIENTEDLRNLAATYTRSLSINSDNPIDPASARRLYQKLLEPELADKGTHEVILIPDSWLYSLPFAALQNTEGTYMAERYIISYAPSVKFLEEIASRPATYQKGATLIIAGTEFQQHSKTFPDLPLALKEAEAASRYGKPSTLYVNETEKTIKKIDLSKFELIHFATHSIIDETQPEHSSLVLKADSGEDGYLTAEEIYRLRIPRSTILLSSCRSGAGQTASGEGILGLSHAFFASGAGSLVMSYWNVKDAEAMEISRRIYKHLLKYPLAEALQKTQLELISSKDKNHPRLWAGFYVYGDGSSRVNLKNPDLFRWAAAAGLTSAAFVIFWLRKKRIERKSRVLSSLSAKG